MDIANQPQKTKKKLSGGIKLLIAVVLVYIFLYLFAKFYAVEAIIGSLAMLARILPIVVLVFFISFGVNLFLKPQKIKKHFGHDSGIKGWLYAVIAGILVSGPPYILYPMLGDLQKSGMRNTLIAVFLYNRNVKIPFIPVMIFYFGLAFTLVISFYIIIFSILSGWLVGHYTEKQPLN